MALDFDYTSGSEAVAFLTTCSSREQRFSVDAFDTLTRHPSGRGDYRFVGNDGRTNEVIDLGGFVLTFWTMTPNV